MTHSVSPVSTAWPATGGICLAVFKLSDTMPETDATSTPSLYSDSLLVASVVMNRPVMGPARTTCPAVPYETRSQKDHQLGQ
jgi:hypothetical protein